LASITGDAKVATSILSGALEFGTKAYHNRAFENVTTLLQIGRNDLSAVVVAVRQWSVVRGFDYLCADAAFTAPPKVDSGLADTACFLLLTRPSSVSATRSHPKVQQMTTNRSHVISASANIPVPPQRAYSIIANYHDEHPRILPSQFSNLAVEKGGIGAGTVNRFNMRVFGRKQSFRAAITEPEAWPRAGGD